MGWQDTILVKCVKAWGSGGIAPSFTKFWSKSAKKQQCDINSKRFSSNVACAIKIEKWNLGLALTNLEPWLQVSFDGLLFMKLKTARTQYRLKLQYDKH